MWSKITGNPFTPSATSQPSATNAPSQSQPVARGYTPVSSFDTSAGKPLPDAPGAESLPADQRAAYNAAYAQLDPKQQAEYQQVYQAVGPEDQKLLQQELIDGKLQQHDTTQGSPGPTTLDQMVRFAKAGDQDVHGVPASQILSQGIHDIANPRAMQQGDSYLCFVMGPVQDLAAKPAQYFGMLSGLAFDNQATTASGEVIKLDPNFKLKPGISPTVGMIGMALLDPSGKPGAAEVWSETGEGHKTAMYGNSFLDPNLEDLPPAERKAMRDKLMSPDLGVDAAQLANLQKTLSGDEYDTEKIDPSAPDSLTAAANTIKSQLEGGKTVEVLLSPPDGSSSGHWVTITGYDPATNTVTYYDGTMKDGQPVAKTEDLDAFLAGTTQGADGQPAHTAPEALTFDTTITDPSTVPDAYLNQTSDDGGTFSMSSGGVKSQNQPSGGGGTTTTSSGG